MSLYIAIGGLWSGCYLLHGPQPSLYVLQEQS